jgi:transcription elongation factor Elf1
MGKKDELRQAVLGDLTNRDFGCPQCGSEEFEVEVWGVGDGIRGEEARAAAVCDSCSARLNVPVDSEIVGDIL